MFKLLLLGYLYGVRSERQLMREVEVNVAYRWFLGLKLRDKVPVASTLSRQLLSPSSESTIYQEIFDEIRAAGSEQGLGLGYGVVYRFDASEGQRQQEQVRSGRRGDVDDDSEAEPVPDAEVGVEGIGKAGRIPLNGKYVGETEEAECDQDAANDGGDGTFPAFAGADFWGESVASPGAANVEGCNIPGPDDTEQKGDERGAVGSLAQSGQRDEREAGVEEGKDRGHGIGHHAFNGPGKSAIDQQGER